MNNRRIDDVHRRTADLRSDLNARFAQVDARLAQVEAGWQKSEKTSG